MKPKKYPLYLLIALLTIGASITLGLLSFAGIYTIIPILTIGVAAFVLSVAYEGEIYWQNLKGALDKLTKRDYLKRLIAKKFLLDLAKNIEHEAECEFIADYVKQLKIVAEYQEQHHLDDESIAKKKQEERTLRHMEKWFAEVAFGKDEPNTPYARQLKNFLIQHGLDKTKNKLRRHQIYYRISQVFSVISGISMGIGTYLLCADLLPLLGFMSLVPGGAVVALLVPAAIFAGAGYALMIYNTITNMINNDTVKNWFIKIKENIQKGSPRSIFIASTAIVLTALALLLTLFTAGTWWTVAQHSMAIAIISGVSQLVFNLENTSESLELIEDISNIKEAPWTSFKNKLSKGWKLLKQNESKWQIVNPFRVITTMILLPLRILLFIGHLISIAVTADQFPGIPQVLTALIGFICEGFEDLHYFFSSAHDHHHKDLTEEQLRENIIEQRISGHEGHSHENDIPTKCIKFLLLPIYAISALWDWHFSKKSDSYLNSFYKQTGRDFGQSVVKPFLAPFALWDKIKSDGKLSFKEALNQRATIHAEKSFEKQAELSNNWKKQHILYHFKKHLEKNHGEEKNALLQEMKEEVRKSKNIAGTVNSFDSKHKSALATHRNTMFKALNPEKTASESLLDRSKAIASPASASAA